MSDNPLARHLTATIRIDITQSHPCIGASTTAALIAKKLREVLPEIEITVRDAEHGVGPLLTHLHQHPEAAERMVTANRIEIYDHCGKGIQPTLGHLVNPGTGTLITKTSDVGKLALS